MTFEVAHSKILEYLNVHGQVNTFRLSRHLKMDRIDLINQVEELSNQGLAEFRYGIVRARKKLQKESEPIIANVNSNSSNMLENQISRIKYFSPVSLQTLNLDKNISVNMLITLWRKFGLNKRDIDDFLRDDKNVGILLNLRKKDNVGENNWKQFIDLLFPKKKPTGRYNNILVSKTYDMLLLVTERKLLIEDLKNLNKIIFQVNRLIKEHNDRNLGFRKQIIIR